MGGQDGAATTKSGRKEEREGSTVRSTQGDTREEGAGEGGVEAMGIIVCITTVTVVVTLVMIAFVETRKNGVKSGKYLELFVTQMFEET